MEKVRLYQENSRMTIVIDNPSAELVANITKLVTNAAGNSNQISGFRQPQEDEIKKEEKEAIETSKAKKLEDAKKIASFSNQELRQFSEIKGIDALLKILYAPVGKAALMKQMQLDYPDEVKSGDLKKASKGHIANALLKVIKSM